MDSIHWSNRIIKSMGLSNLVESIPQRESWKNGSINHGFSYGFSYGFPMVNSGQWWLMMANHWLIMAGWWYSYPSEKWWSESQLGWFSIPNWMDKQSKCSKPPTSYECGNTSPLSEKFLDHRFDHRFPNKNPLDQAWIVGFYSDYPCEYPMIIPGSYPTIHIPYHSWFSSCKCVYIYITEATVHNPYMYIYIYWYTYLFIYIYIITNYSLKSMYKLHP